MEESQWKRVCLASFLFLVIALFSVAIFKKEHRYQLSVLAIFQDEDRFLKEWLDFYRVLGVEHFYLFNNLSDDQYLEVLEPYIKNGIVELFDWPFESLPGNEADWTRLQSAAYQEGLNMAKGESKWVAILDTDEFLFPLKAKNLPSFLSDYDNCSGILVNWQMFGSSHVAKIPDNQLMIETLLFQAPPQSPLNAKCKSIVRPEAVKTCNNPHSVIYYPWTYAVDPDKNIFSWDLHPFRPIKIDKVRINHYWSRDEEFLHTHKLARHENWGNKKQACLQCNQEANQQENRDILVFVPEIKKLQREE